MKLAGIELRYLVNELAGSTGEYYVSNIYGVSRDAVLFKLHHPEKPDIMLMFSTFGMWPSSVKIRQIEPNALLRRLRQDLLRARLEGVEQLGIERIAYLRFDGSGGQFVLAGEFFGDGNIILCDGSMRILALLHSLDVRHRRLRAGLTYEPPPANSADVLRITMDDLGPDRKADLASDRWLGRKLGLPTRYVQAIFHKAKIDPKVQCSELSAENLEGIAFSARELASRVVEGRHEPVIVETDGIREVHPVRLSEEGRAVPSFAEGLDELLTHIILESGKEVQSRGAREKMLELETAIGEQDKAIQTVSEKSDGIAELARSLLGLVSTGTSSFGDPKVEGIVRGCGAKLITEKGVPLVLVRDEKIIYDPDSSIHTIASHLFDEAKKQSHAIPEIERLRTKAQKKLRELQSGSQEQKDTDAFTEIRRKAWYERYRWFRTSDGALAIGGRDASSNSSIIRKHLETDDVVFHADIFGSPFFILKGGRDATPAALGEVAHATVCFSRAWRESMYGLSAYWVSPEQVKKAAPSGQYLPRGSFTIDGQRNFVRVTTLKLAVGVMEQGSDYVLSCGPPEAIAKRALMYASIEPSGAEMTDAAKKLRSEFLKINDVVAKRIPVDEFVRALPAGKSRVGAVEGQKS